MPRLSQSVPKYRKHKASGQAIVEINAKRHYLGPYRSTASRIEYDRLITEWLASGRSTSFGAPESDLTVGQLLVAYLKHAQEYYGDGPRTEFVNMRNAVRPLRELYSRHPARHFGPLELKAVRHRFIAAGHCRSYVNASVRRIIRVFRWGVAQGLVEPKVAGALAMVPGLRRGRSAAPESRKVKPANEELIEAALHHLSPTVRAMVELQRLSGCRPGELVILRPADVDRSGAVWEFKPTAHKTAHYDKERTVYIGPKAQDVLRPFLLRCAEVFCFSPLESEIKRRAELTAARRTPVTCGNGVGTNRQRRPKRRPQDRYTPASYCRAVQRACDRAYPFPAEIADDPHAVKKWQREHRFSPNQLRHGLATRVRREFDLDAARTLLGHATIGVTQHYAEKDRRRAMEVAKAIG